MGFLREGVDAAGLCGGQAANVRLRAERRVGELLKEMARAEAGAARNPNGRAGKEPASNDATAALDDMGMSRQTAHRYQRLAEAEPREEKPAGGVG